MPDWVLAVYAAAIGFSVSGVVASAWAWLSGGRELAGGRMLLPAILAVCAFGGPYLVLAGVGERWRTGRMPAHLAAPLVAICLFWCFCSGVLVIQALWAANLLAA